MSDVQTAKRYTGKWKGGNRGPGAKVERKQVDNDRFQSNQHNQQNTPRIPQPFYHLHIMAHLSMKTQLPLPYSDMYGRSSMAGCGYTIGEGLSRHFREKV